MRILPFLIAAAVCSSSGCTDAAGPTGHTTASLRASGIGRAGAARAIDATGNFTANVDFSTLTLTPRGNNCVLSVSGQLVFTGTISGTTSGRTTAMVLAPCADVATTPPGTFRDVFKSPFTFTGTVAGQPVEATGVYQGGVDPGGHIDGEILFLQGMHGVLRVNAVVAQGGSYRGTVVLP
jgi:hypothetical protein